MKKAFKNNSMSPKSSKSDSAGHTLPASEGQVLFEKRLSAKQVDLVCKLVLEIIDSNLEISRKCNLIAEILRGPR